MSYEVGSRVIAIRNAETDPKPVLYVFGAGVYAGDFTPPGIKIEGFKNPRIDLDNGGRTWGFECWWGPEERVLKEYPKDQWEYIEVQSVIPLEA